ncbi:MFS general substrate transporter, partial [Apiospora arundinis]
TTSTCPSQPNFAGPMDLPPSKSAAASESTNKVLRPLQTVDTDHEISHPNESRTLSPPARLCAETIQLFHLIVRKAYQPSKSVFPDMHQRSLERSLERLKLWADAYEVTSGGMDSLFNSSRRVHNSIFGSLLEISKTLTERLTPRLLIGPVDSKSYEALGMLTEKVRGLIETINDDYIASSLSDSFSDCSPDNLEEITEDLKSQTLGLMELDPLIRHPVTDPRVETYAPGIAQVTWLPYKPYCEKVENRFPQAPDLLVSRLARANYERYLRCQRERDRETADRPGDGDTPNLAKTALTVGDSIFGDSALGSSLGTGSSYAETVMSYRASGGELVRIPPLSQDEKAGQPFKCLACGKFVTFKTNSHWKRHVYLDLRPWVCLDPTCHAGDQAFDTQKDWIAHLALEHNLEPGWNSFTCPLCKDETGPGKMAITKHLSRHLEELSLSALPSAHAIDNSCNEVDDNNADIQEDVGSNQVARMPQLIPTPLPYHSEFWDFHLHALTIAKSQDLLGFQDWSSFQDWDSGEANEDLPKKQGCPNCHYIPGGKPDKAATYLRKHMATIHSGQKFNCKQCEKVYTRKDNLTNHIKKVHGISVPRDGPSTSESKGSSLSKDDRSGGGDFAAGVIVSQHEGDPSTIAPKNTMLDSSRRNESKLLLSPSRETS